MQYVYNKIPNKPEMELVWRTDTQYRVEMKQTITIFTQIACKLVATEEPSRWNVSSYISLVVTCLQFYFGQSLLDGQTDSQQSALNVDIGIVDRKRIAPKTCGSKHAIQLLYVNIKPMTIKLLILWVRKN